ncbi:MAG: hypothetical protein KDJ38_11605 [Gammaproteobacteria bacterium]|nr:hypothetical protein [Gammaproteobacteria bacterium]
MRKIAYSCYVDAHPKFEKEVRRWLWSLIEKLGVDPSNIFITCSPRVSPQLVAFIQRHKDVNLFFEERFTDQSPPANKWLQLKALTDCSQDYSHIVISDCDKVFLQFSEEWCNESIRACKFVPRPSFSIFEQLFQKYFGVQPRFVIDNPDPRDPAKDKRNYVNNHNGGLIIVPRQRLKELALAWRKWIDALLQEPELLGPNLRNLDQVAFSIAMHELQSDINFLPKSFDIGPNVRHIEEQLFSPGSGQLVLHIHGFDDDEGNIICGDETPEKYRQIIAALNKQYIAWKQLVVDSIAA